MFKTELVVSPMIGTRSTFRLKENLVYKLNESFEITALKGFVYDGASIPAILTNLLPKIGYKYDRASCLHDWLYATADITDLSRKSCDKIFYQAMRDDKVSWILAQTMFWAVRIFGKSHYGGSVCI